MGRRGPQPTPTKILKAAGSRLLYERGNEPIPDVEIPESPDWLGDEGKREWDRITHELEKLGIVALIDKTALVAHCRAYQALFEAVAHLDEEGYVINQPTGNKVKNPWAAVAEKAIDQIYRGAQLFGMSPSARVGLRAKSKTDVKDDKSRFFVKKEVS